MAESSPAWLQVEEEDNPYDCGKVDRIIRFSPQLDLPPAYSSNTIQEDVILELAGSFQTQLMALYPDRETPLLAPHNEAGSRKFISTFIRPTTLALGPRYFDLKPLSTFLAHYVRFNPHPQPESITAPNPSSGPFPTIAQSPSTTLAWQTGDAVDLAILLCSALSGAGFAAYVVIGYASVAVAKADVSGRPAPSALVGALLGAHTHPAAPTRKVYNHDDLVARCIASETSARVLQQDPCTGTVSARPPSSRRLRGMVASPSARPVASPFTDPSSPTSPTNPLAASVSSAVAAAAPLTDTVGDGSGDDGPSNPYQIVPPKAPPPAYARPAVAIPRAEPKDTNVDALDTVATDAPPPPPLMRPHAWVMIPPGGPREVRRCLYVEPTTGDVIALPSTMRNAAKDGPAVADEAALRDALRVAFGAADAAHAVVDGDPEGALRALGGATAEMYGAVELVFNADGAWVYVGPDAPPSVAAATEAAVRDVIISDTPAGDGADGVGGLAGASGASGVGGYEWGSTSASGNVGAVVAADGADPSSPTGALDGSTGGPPVRGDDDDDTAGSPTNSLHDATATSAVGGVNVPPSSDGVRRHSILLPPPPPPGARGSAALDIVVEAALCAARRIPPVHIDVSDPAVWESALVTDVARQRRPHPSKAAFVVGPDGAADGGTPVAASGLVGRGVATQVVKTGELGNRVPMLPRPWTQRAALPTSAVVQCYVGGQTTLRYSDFTVTLHTYNTTPDLCVLRATDNMSSDEHALFGPREDRLVRRSVYAATSTTKEWFAPGRRRDGGLESLKLHVYTPGVTREFWFHVDARLDGLILRKELLAPATVGNKRGGKGGDAKVKVHEYFHGRTDRLLFRSSKYSVNGPKDFPVKVSVRFDRDPSAAAHNDIEWIHYVLPGTPTGHATVLFQHAPDSISRPTHTYKRTQTVDVVQHPFLPEPSPAALVARMRSLFANEKDLLADLREADLDAAAMLRTRAHEEARVAPMYAVYLPLVDPSVITKESTEPTDAGADRDKDPFGRYVQQVIAARTTSAPTEALTRDEALAVYNAVTVDFRRRSQRRAQIMAKRLEDERAALARRQAAFQRAHDADAVQETEAFNAFVEKAVWRIHLVGPWLCLCAMCVVAVRVPLHSGHPLFPHYIPPPYMLSLFIARVLCRRPLCAPPCIAVHRRVAYRPPRGRGAGAAVQARAATARRSPHRHVARGGQGVNIR